LDSRDRLKSGNENAKLETSSHKSPTLAPTESYPIPPAKCVNHNQKWILTKKPYKQLNEKTLDKQANAQRLFAESTDMSKPPRAPGVLPAFCEK